MSSVDIPESVSVIGVRCFSGCSGLSTISIPGSVTKIDEAAFEKCSNLTSLAIPKSVNSIGYGITSGDNSLTSLIVEEGNDKYDSRNNCNAIIETATNKLIAGCKNTVIPTSVTCLGSNCFSGLTFTSFDIPNTITSMEGRVFYGCSSLTSITIPNSITSIAHSSFLDCSSLTSVIIPNSVTNIDPYAFGGCSSFTSITIPSHVKDIGTCAFWKCDNLKQVISLIESPVPYISSGAFGKYSTESGVLYVPVGTKSQYQSKIGWREFKTIVEGTPSAINSLSLDEEATESTRYTIDGKKISKPQKGLNIIRYKDGSARKEIVK